LGLFALTVVRVFARQLSEPDPFTRLASAGLVLLFALQALINMAVSVGLIPAKGITLPLISSGGSSTLATGLAMGMLLALTRRRPDPARVKKPSFVARRAVSYDPTGPMPS
jgi:cell division protein FtsW